MRTKKFTLLMVLVAAVLFAIPAQAFLWNWAEQTPQFKSKSGLVNTDNVRQPLWKFTGRELSNFRRFDGQTQASRRAATKDEHGLITDPDEGVTKYYKRAGTAFYVSNNSVYNEDQSGIVTILEAEGGKVYIKDPVSHYSQGTWVEGTKDGNTITVAGAQPLAWNSSYSATLSLNWGNVQTTQTGNTYLRGDGNITFTVDDEAGTITLDGSSADKIIAVFWDDDNSWSGYGDYGTVWTLNTEYEPASTDPIVLPDGAEVQQWYAEGEGSTAVPTDVKVAFVGNEVYISGLTSNFPDAWIKGALDGTTVTFSKFQFVGMYSATMPIWAVGADSDTGNLQDFTMTYDSEAQTLTLDENQLLVFNAAEDRMYYISYIESLTIYAEKPAPAQIDELPYVNSFDDAASQKHFTIIDANEDGRTWNWYNGMARYTYSSTNQGDDWLVSPAIKLVAGKKYAFSVAAHAQQASYPERLEVKAAQENTAEALAAGTEVLPSTDVTTPGFVTYENNVFTVAETGYYYIGVHAISDADSYYLYVDDFEVKLKEPEDIEISPESGADIATALATAEEGKNVKNITINLAEGGNYTISASIVAPANVTINGNGATIDASGLEGDFITLNGSTDKVLLGKDGDNDVFDATHFYVESVTVKDITMTGLKGSFIRDAQKTLLATLTIENANIQMPSSNKQVINFNSKGYVGNVVVKNSTIWAKEKNNGYFAQYGSRPNNFPEAYRANFKQLFDIQNSTFVWIANGQNFCNFNQKGTANNGYTLKNNIFVDCGKNGQVIQGINSNQKSTTPAWDVDNNVFNWGGKDVSEAEAAGTSASYVKNSIEGVVTFTDAANGDFNGEIAITWGKDIPAALPGDPRWTLTSSQAPAVPDGNYVVANLSFDPLKYLANGNVSKYGTTFTTAYDKATKTTTLKAGDQYLQEDLTLGATAFGWTVDEDATYGNNIYKMDGETKKFIGVDDETNNLVFVEDAANATIAWGFFYPEYFYAMMALREVTGPLAGTMKLNEGTGLWEYTAKKVLMTDATSINVQVVINGEADKTYPEEAKVVTLADMGEGATAGCYAITITYNDEGNVVTVSGTKLDAEDIIVEPADISAVDGDIAAAVEAKTDGKLIKSLTINLGENFEYTISNTILTDGSVIINGNGATIDASDLKKPFIQMSATPSVDANDKGGYEIDGVTIKDVTITGLPYQLFYANKQNYLLKQLLVENSVIGINGTNKKTIFDFNGGGNVLDLTVNKSTLWANPTNGQNGGFFSSQSGKNVTDLSSATDLRTTLTITSSTLYNITNGKTVNSLRNNNQAYQYVVVKDNVIADCGKKNEFLVGLMGGRIDASKVANWTVSGNVINWGGADVLAAEATKSGLTDIGIAGAVTFTDAANGDFNGTFTAAPVEEPVEESASRRDAEEATLLTCGDPRWTIVCVQGYAINIDTKYGNVTTAPASYAVEGEEVTITVKPNPADKFELLTLKVEGVTSDIEIELTPVEGTTDQFTFTMPADAVNIIATFQRIAEDIIVNPEDIEGGDITAALNKKIAALVYTDPQTQEEVPGRVKDITINLAEGEAYTVAAAIKAPANVTINGNGATIDASGADANFIELQGSSVKAIKADGETESDHYLIDAVTINKVTVNGLKKAIIRDTQKTLLKALTIENSVIEASDGKPALDFDGKGYIEQVTVNNSTVWSSIGTNKFFAKYGSRPKNLWSGDDAGPYTVQGFDVQNSTFVNIANSKNFCDISQKGTVNNVYTLKNNIFVNCGKSGQVVVGFNGGQTSATPTWDVDGNVFNYDGNDVSAAEVSKAGKKADEDIVKNSLPCRVLFSSVETPDFGGILVLAPGTEAPETLPGDPRWSLSVLNGNTITVQTSNGHGTASAQYPYAIEGEEVGLTIKPEDGYEVESIVILDADGYVIGLVTGDTFTMPGQDVVIYVGFKKTATGIDAIENDADFEEGEWYTINGVRVDQPTKKGLYIHNGKKIVIK